MRALPLLALLVVPLAQASWLDDASGDVRADAQGTPASVPGIPAYASLDLLGLDVLEEAEAFTFTLHFADLGASAEDTSPDGTVCDLFFVHGERGFRILLSRLTPAAVGDAWGRLLVRDGNGPWEYRFEADLTTTMDVAADAVTLRLARGDMADASGTAPFPGRTLEDVRVACRNYASSISLVGGDTPPLPLVMRDDLPDAGLAAGAWPTQVGAKQTGHALLTSAQPFRASNGEATTFVYNVTLHNLGAAEDGFKLAVRDVPASVTVSLAQDGLTVPAGGAQDFNVWVTVPFAHQHGATTQFLLEAASLSDPGSVGRVHIGVRYLTVPQPAGHHDRLYVHSFPVSGATDTVVKQAPGIFGNGGYLNTLEEDSGDSHDGISYSFGNNNGASESYTWSIYLGPALLMGLDTDLGRLGQLTASFGSRTPLETATVAAKVYVTGGPDLPVIAVMAPVPLTAAGDLYSASGELVPQAEGDLVPFAKGHNLVLDLTVENNGALAALPFDAPYLMPGTWMQLPLLDYHDSLAGLPVAGAIVVAGNATPLEQQEEEESPAAPWLTVVALVVAAVWVRRR